MNFSDFLQQAKTKKIWSNKKVICFKGQNYPILFFNRLFKILHQKNILPAPHKNLFINSTDKKQLQANLQQSFLGQKSFYWLGEYNFKGKDQNKLLDFLTVYKEPHFIAFFLNDEIISCKISSNLKKNTVINMQDIIDESIFKKILKLFDLNFSNEKLKFVSKFFKQTPPRLDQVCMLMQYLELINSKATNIFYNYLMSTILEMQTPLTLLSQYFFSRQIKPFLKIWSTIYNEYPEMFWISFWSEQIWRAYYVVKFLKQKNYTQARRVSFRLPFTFINKDWKNFCPNSLARQHQFLYNNDFKLKKGSTFCFLDLFYIDHFINKYSQGN